MSYTLIRNGTLIDGNGGKPIPNAAVLIEDNKIRSVGTADSIRLPNASITTLDAKGGTILPGLIDTHVHLMMEIEATDKAMQEPFSMKFFKSTQYMRRTLDAGITTVRDAGGADLGVKQAVEQGIVSGPRMQISISVLGITGGHTDGWMPSGVTF